MIKKQSKKILALALLLVFVMALGSIAPAFAIQVSLPGDPAQFLGEPNGRIPSITLITGPYLMIAASNPRSLTESM